MFRFKVFLFFSMLPMAYLVYHLIGFENGLNAYVQKIKILKSKLAYQNQLTEDINLHKNKILLLDQKNINLDYLEEKSFELGKSPNTSYTIVIK
ncbi:MAG: hypothetical protein CMJ06_05770 [Pelagibacterales bacterium]|nr:hypothetical protein [Pelagibacterales bacterium]OUU61285.1 MAG: hypothetical protein CBC22_07915 [Alphaproteobacteria bacterium TMED62]|tara:strand:- start:1212 stop:1493 length:282 start_codon:yes stop_codon:yes gene_type:complete